MTESKGEKAKCQSGKNKKTKIDHREKGKGGHIVLRGREEEGEEGEREAL